MANTINDRKRYVVYDCDIGTDDAWGLLMLIKAEQLSKDAKCLSSELLPGKIEILGVTCVQGNTDVHNCARNALRVLDAVGRLDIPIFKGCADPILPRTWTRRRLFHGVDGFGDLKHEKQMDEKLIKAEHAANAMYRLACEHPNMVDFLLVGPLTNFATCITLYGDDFLSKIHNVYIMGGNYRGKGNITKSAEFNFMMDPEAAHIVLARTKQVVILPWESCIDGDFGLTLDWRLNVLGAVKSEAITLMNYVESAILVPRGFDKWIVCDALLVAAYLFPQHIIGQSRTYHTTVELHGAHTRGQMVLDHLHDEKHNAAIIMTINKAQYKHVISWTAGVAGVNIEDLSQLND